MTALQRLNGGIIRPHAYPEVGRRIKLSQGSGTVRVDPTSSIWWSLTVRGRKHDEFVIGPLRRGESVLSEAQEPAAGMVECAKSAFADLNGLLIPGFGEEWLSLRSVSTKVLTCASRNVWAKSARNSASRRRALSFQ